MGHRKSEETANQMFRLADFDENNSIEFSEWCTILMDKSVMLTDERIKAAFDTFDIKKNG